MRLKLKQMMAVSLSVAMLLAVAPGEAVFANVKQDNIVNTTVSYTHLLLQRLLKVQESAS